MRSAIVTQSDAHDAGFGMLDNEDHREGLVFRRRMSGGKGFQRAPLRFRLEPVKLVPDGEPGWKAAHQRMIRLSHCHFEFAVAIVAT